jgi:hypothetical protein
MKLRLADFGIQLTGRVLGKKHFAKACELLAEAAPGELVILDFSGVDRVNGSWVNAMVVPLIQWMANERNNFFPVIQNAQKDWLDEFRLVADWYHLGLLVATDHREPPCRAALVGPLDPGQRATLDAVLEYGEVTGAELERCRKSENVQATAWNNRLRDLFEKRLIRRRKQGREQIYFPVVKEVTVHG